MIVFDQKGTDLSNWSLGSGLLLNLWTVAVTSQWRRVLCSMVPWRNLKMSLGHGSGRVAPLGNMEVEALSKSIVGILMG
jgi:hypothetical protein